MASTLSFWSNVSLLKLCYQDKSGQDKSGLFFLFGDGNWKSFPLPNAFCPKKEEFSCSIQQCVRTSPVFPMAKKYDVGKNSWSQRTRALWHLPFRSQASQARRKFELGWVSLFESLHLALSHSQNFKILAGQNKTFQTAEKTFSKFLAELSQKKEALSAVTAAAPIDSRLIQEGSCRATFAFYVMFQNRPRCRPFRQLWNSRDVLLKVTGVVWMSHPTQDEVENELCTLFINCVHSRSVYFPRSQKEQQKQNRFRPLCCLKLTCCCKFVLLCFSLFLCQSIANRQNNVSLYAAQMEGARYMARGRCFWSSAWLQSVRQQEKQTAPWGWVDSASGQVFSQNQFPLSKNKGVKSISWFWGLTPPPKKKKTLPRTEWFSWLSCKEAKNVERYLSTCTFLEGRPISFVHVNTLAEGQKAVQPWVPPLWGITLHNEEIPIFLLFAIDRAAKYSSSETGCCFGTTCEIPEWEQRWTS